MCIRDRLQPPPKTALCALADAPVWCLYSREQLSALVRLSERHRHWECYGTSHSSGNLPTIIPHSSPGHAVPNPHPAVIS
eukprot:580719-Alexandrium_andersonii.AAC.1